MCGDSPGAAVRKNAITDSGQRCVVIHGSHNVTIEGASFLFLFVARYSSRIGKWMWGLCSYVGYLSCVGY